MSSEGECARDLFRTLAYKGFRRDRSQTGTYLFTGTLPVAGREVGVAIEFRDLEFTRLPKLTLLNPDDETPDFVAHLEASGALCFARNEDLVLDRYDVGGTALMCLELARRGLERALTHKRLQGEIAQEFPQHWLGENFYYDVEETVNCRAKFHSVPRDGSTALLFLADTGEKLKRLVPGKADRRRIAGSSRPAFVFRSDRELTFPPGFRQPRTLEEFLAWLEAMVPGGTDRALKELSSEFPGAPVPLFVRAENGCIGISVDANDAALRGAQRREGFRRIARTNAGRVEVERLSGARIDLPTIFGRNMHKQSPLTGRRIALIGCGTIGSHLAKFLVQSGAGHDGGVLLLIDNQSFEPGNVGRHYLGTARIGEWKAEAVKQELQCQFPEAQIQAVRTGAEGMLASLASYDLVVDSTGEEALSLALNHGFVARRGEKERVPDVIHVWLFGNGAAGQALLVDGPQFACFKCLKPDHEGRWRFDPLKSGTKVEQTAAACGEAQYIAYGVAAPTMAAALGLQLVLDWNGGDPAPRLRTIRVEKKVTVEVKDRNPPPSVRCPACARSS
ncbi:MAG: ThiF family adenylyltransferase [Rhodobacteraceae bacterium]|nr:ThiF family adenylyltransferase [Paracoccaceae bacterium]